MLFPTHLLPLGEVHVLEQNLPVSPHRTSATNDHVKSLTSSAGFDTKTSFCLLLLQVSGPMLRQAKEVTGYEAFRSVEPIRQIVVYFRPSDDCSNWFIRRINRNRICNYPL